ncbi:MAG: hypothetical protein AAF799_17020 [Myxococcota bacterium]
MIRIQEALATAILACLPALGCGPQVEDPGASTSDGETDEGSGDERGDPGADGQVPGGRDDGRDPADEGGGADGGAADEVGGDPDDPNDPLAVRACYGCWEDNSASCEALDTCKADLACSQLLDCPFACGGTLDCVAECNEIIPSGVEPLTELVQCMVCEGAPCAEDCQNDVMQSYCG